MILIVFPRTPGTMRFTTAVQSIALRVIAFGEQALWRHADSFGNGLFQVLVRRTQRRRNAAT